MWNLVEDAYNKMIGSLKSKAKLLPILPNLITSTDEVTVFATASTVHGKESYYLVSKPDYVKNEAVDSRCRNHYKKTPTGDAHCRGVRVVINCSFTAGGLSSLLFVVVYGIGKDEMFCDEDIVTVKVPGLTIGSNQDVYSCGLKHL